MHSSFIQLQVADLGIDDTDGEGVMVDVRLLLLRYRKGNNKIAMAG
jgi:hypothetical protein